jgi:predicted HAD superfamily Cof-like phosphohydrolase
MSDKSEPLSRDTDLQYTFEWFCEAYRDRPSTNNNLHTQLGVHFEEIAELMRTINSNGSNVLTISLLGAMYKAAHNLAEHLKKNSDVIWIVNREEYLDALCDQIVTAVGCGYHAKMAIVGAFAEVNRSNFSKFDDNGKAVLDENLKVAKSSNYRRADLTPFV